MKHARPDYARFQDPAGKIPADEPVFLLRGQDVLAADTVRAYARAAWAAGRKEIGDICADWAETMDNWRTKIGGGKLPDLPDASTEAVAEDAPGEPVRVSPVKTLRLVLVSEDDTILGDVTYQVHALDKLSVSRRILRRFAVGDDNSWFVDKGGVLELRAALRPNKRPEDDKPFFSEELVG